MVVENATGQDIQPVQDDMNLPKEETSNVVGGHKDPLLDSEQQKASNLDIKSKDGGDISKFTEEQEGGLRKSLTLFNGISMSEFI